MADGETAVPVPVLDNQFGIRMQSISADDGKSVSVGMLLADRVLIRFERPATPNDLDDEGLLKPMATFVLKHNNVVTELQLTSHAAFLLEHILTKLREEGSLSLAT